MSRSHAIDPTPSGPPPEVLAEVRAAWERAEGFFASGFSLDLRPGRWTRRLRAELCGPGDALAERLTLCELLALACGEE